LRWSQGGIGAAKVVAVTRSRRTGKMLRGGNREKEDASGKKSPLEGNEVNKGRRGKVSLKRTRRTCLLTEKEMTWGPTYLGDAERSEESPCKLFQGRELKGEKWKND